MPGFPTPTNIVGVNDSRRDLTTPGRDKLYHAPA